MRAGFLSLVALLGCAREKVEPVDSDPQADTASPDDTADPGDPPLPSTARCDRTRGGPATDAPAAVAFSEAHAAIRLFGEAEDFVTSDRALVAAIQAGAALAPDAETYAEALSLCLLPAEEPLGPAVVELRGGLAWVQPGVGEVALPEGATGLVIDLRGLPADPRLPEALAAAVAPALREPVSAPRWKVRQWSGFVDQVFASSSVYSSRSRQISGPDLDASGAEELPVVLVTEARLAPAAVAFAAALSERAWIVGEDVLTAVGALSWSPLGEHGLLWKSGQLRGPDGDLPDTLPATLRAADPEAALAEADLSGWPSPVAPSGVSTDAPLPARDPYDEDRWSRAAGAEEFAADLIIAHGMFRYFFPYFDVVGDSIDDRLLEVLAEPAADRSAQRQALGRLGEALHDGHVFFGDYYRDDVAGYLPVTFDYLDGRPVVVHSALDSFAPGDTLMAVDGVDSVELLDALRAWHGAGTEGYSTDLAGRELMTMSAEATYTLMDPSGVAREELVSPQPYSALSALTWVAHDRPSGMLDDLGAPDIAYLNMSDEVTTSLSQVEALLAEAVGARGLVVDMRGYPGVDHYSVASALITDPFQSAVFNIPEWTGPAELAIDSSYYSYEPDPDAFSGPIVLLTSPTSVSAAENFSMMLVGAHRVTVVGRNSAGTNGNITGARLPGGFYITFTGMEVLFPDGSTFHGIGIVPDVEVAPTATDYRDGLDPELEAAVAELGG